MDYFFYKTYLFLIKLKKNDGDAKWSAFLFTGVYFAISILSLNCFIGILYENPLSMLMKSKPLFFWMLIFILSPVLLSLRYYWHLEIASIKVSYNAMGVSKRRIVNAFIYVALVAIPLLTFILFRLYVVGQFKWW
jgi:hypothetical protein